MKKSLFTLAFTTFMAGTIFTSCNSPAEKVDAARAKVEDASQNLDQVTKDYNDQYNTFKLASDQKIADNEKSISELKEHTEKMKKEAKDEYEKAIAALEQKNETLKEKVKDYKGDGSEKWESFKLAFNHDLDELGQSLKDFAKKSSN
jgi:F0F1-type ATP synthase membrane subunit b/b'